tara:strand:+ start:4435 stop:5016 length:582 start_codon:yes stop_codon:yes gene_type:complete
MSYFVNAAPIEETSISDLKKKPRNHTLKRHNKPKLPNINFNEDENDLADFKPLAPPKLQEPHMTKNLEQEFIHEGFKNEQEQVSNYPQKYDEKPMSKMQQHQQFMNNIKNNLHPTNSSLEYNPPAHSHNITAEELSEDQKELKKKIDYMIQLLEQQKSEKTDGVLEDVILYSFLGIFMIFLAESFTKSGKYVR